MACSSNRPAFQFRSQLEELQKPVQQYVPLCVLRAAVNETGIQMNKRQLGSAARGWPGGSQARTSSIRQSALVADGNPVLQRLAVGRPKGLECCDKVCVGSEEQRGPI